MNKKNIYFKKNFNKIYHYNKELENQNSNTTENSILLRDDTQKGTPFLGICRPLVAPKSSVALLPSAITAPGQSPQT
jgi:hypothetical protein